MKKLCYPAALAMFALSMMSCASYSHSGQRSQGPYGTRMDAIDPVECDADGNPIVYDDYDDGRNSNRRRRATRNERRSPERYSKRLETFHLTIGKGDMDDETFWQGLDDPGFIGVDYTSTTEDSGLGAEVGFQFWGDSTGSSSTDEDLSVAEVFAGIRQTWNADRSGPHPYIGVGGTLLGANLESPTYDETEGTFGFYGHAGFTVPLGSAMEIGLDYRIVRGTEVDFPGGPESDLDYDRLALVLGWSF